MKTIGLVVAVGWLALLAAFALPAQAGDKGHGFGIGLGIGPGSLRHKEPPVYEAPKRRKTYERKVTKTRTPAKKSNDTAKAAPVTETAEARYEVEHSSITSESGNIEVSAQIDASEVETGSTGADLGCKRYMAAVGQTVSVPCD